MRESHQNRFKKETLIKSRDILFNNINELKKTKDYHSLYMTIRKLIIPIQGVGELYCYDTTLKIGSFLKIFPDYIYLHRGTRIGAERLRLAYKKEYLTMKEIPREFKKLLPYELEDFFCIYKDEFNTP